MTREMVDSAFPLGAPPPGGWRDIILIYAGGDTPHPWTRADIDRMPARYRFPTWVRSNPAGKVEGAAEAAAFVAWLHAMGAPRGSSVCLDLEVAIATAYVNAFNGVMLASGFKTTKYGAGHTDGTGPIWANPQTSGGTFIAQPDQLAELPAFGDMVAKQFAFDGGYDLSITADQTRFPLWDTKPGPPPGDAAQPVHVTGHARFTNATISWVPQANTQSIMAYLAHPDGTTIEKSPALLGDALAYKFHRLREGTEYKLGVLAKPEAPGVQAQYVTVKTLG